MNWREEWEAIAGSIRGFVQAARFASTYGQRLSKLTLDELDHHSSTVYRKLGELELTHGQHLPPAAAAELSRFRMKQFNLFQREMALEGGAASRAGALVSFAATFAYLIRDNEDQVVDIAERAFMHLQRLIVADPAVGGTWRDAFEKGEPECEKLGATHLLLHGAYAFKAHAPGERTDLVLGTKMNDEARLRRAVRGLVLTEWKRAVTPDEVADKIDEARKQAARYSVGSLGGFEVVRTRYLVIVTRELSQFSDLLDGGITYRVMNIAVEPKTPSKAARERSN